jgi:hypothetical protein
MIKCTLLHHETICYGNPGRIPPASKGSLRFAGKNNETGCREIAGGIRRESGKEVEEITRMERDRKRRQPQPDPNPAFLTGGSMANATISKVTLSPSYELTTEHAASSYGHAVLFNRKTREAFGPGDIIKHDGEFKPASKVVDLLTQDMELSIGQRIFVDDFINF